jgi:hypothetical protein
MKKYARLLVIPVLAIVFILTACNLPFKAARGAQDSQTSAGNATSAASNAEKTVDPRPVGVQEGLGSFDNYRMRIQVNSSDSDGKIDDYAEFIERSLKDGSMHSHTESTTFDPSTDSEKSTSTTDVYEVGLVTCQKSGEDESWTYTEMTDDDKEIRDIFKGMVDFEPVIANPTFVGPDTVNGIPSNHFTFQVEGIGAKSGAVATTNAGDYWLAQDGQYLVKYSLELDIHSADNTTWNKMEVLMDLTDVNSEAIDIEQPTDCVKSE